MKADERAFLDAIKGMPPNFSVRDVIRQRSGTMNHKRAWYVLGKWARKGWYDYGVTLDLGWLTEKGKEQ